MGAYYSSFILSITRTTHIISMLLLFREYKTPFANEVVVGHEARMFFLNTHEEKHELVVNSSSTRTKERNIFQHTRAHPILHSLMLIAVVL